MSIVNFNKKRLPGAERAQLARLMERRDDVSDDLIASLAKSSNVMPSDLSGHGYEEALHRMALEIQCARLIFRIAKEDL